MFSSAVETVELSMENSFQHSPGNRLCYVTANLAQADWDRRLFAAIDFATMLLCRKENYRFWKRGEKEKKKKRREMLWKRKFDEVSSHREIMWSDEHWDLCSGALTWLGEAWAYVHKSRRKRVIGIGLWCRTHTFSDTLAFLSFHMSHGIPNVERCVLWASQIFLLPQGA